MDGLVWSCVCLVLHGYALARLLLDERRIVFSSPDVEQLSRFFYRRSGMRRFEVQQVCSPGGRAHNASCSCCSCCCHCRCACCPSCSHRLVSAPGSGLAVAGRQPPLHASTAQLVLAASQGPSRPCRARPQVLKYGRWRRVKAGQQILSELESRGHLCLLVEGQAALFTRRALCSKLGKAGVMLWVLGA